MMKTTYKIARLELKTLFSSPVAWLLLIIFAVQTILDLAEKLKAAIANQHVEMQGIGSELRKAFVTQDIFGFGKLSEGMLVHVTGHWYLYIPLLTMGLVSRELGSGNIKLLFSSPVKIREIVTGKFLGIMMYWAMLMGILLIFVLVACLVLTNIDVPFIFSCLLGVYLLAMLYSSIGLFVSCLTTYPIVAAIGTFVVLAALDYFGGLWQGVPFLRDVTWFINTAAHTENLLKGLIISRDIVYFLSLTLMFIGLAKMVLENKVHFRPFAVQLGRYLALMTMILLIGYIFSRPQLTWYRDVTAFKSNTLNPATQAVLKQLKGPVKVTIFDNLFMNVKDIGNPDHVNENIRKWEPYKRFLPELEIDYVHFYMVDTVGNYPGSPGINIRAAALAVAKERKLDVNDYAGPDSIAKLIDLKAYNNGTVIRILNQGKSVILRSPVGIESEEYITANLKQMIYGADTLAFLSGNGERSIVNEGERDYKQLIYDRNSFWSLNANGFEAFSHDPAKPIPGHAAILVIADPAVPYTAEALQHIRDYMASGKNVLIAKGNNDPAILEQLTKPLGVEFMLGYLVQPDKEKTTSYVKLDLDKTALEDTTYFSNEWKQVSQKKVTALTYTTKGDFNIKPLLLTDAKNTWNKRLESTMDTGRYDFHPEQGDIQSILPAAVVLTRQIKGRQQRIMVIGNADFMASSNNMYFRRTVFRWLSNGKFPLNKLRKDPAENEVMLSYKQTDMLKYWLMIGVCGFLIVFGSIYLLKRRSL